MLEVHGLTVSYGAIDAVCGIDLIVRSGEAVALLGPNGAGKSSTLQAISRLVDAGGGLRFDGQDLHRLRADAVARLGLIHVPEGRRVYVDLDVEENLLMGRLAASGRPATFELSDVYDLFPALTRLRNRRGGALSGGEQQMVAIGRALMSSPRLLMLDEPSLGLAPVIMDAVFAALAQVRAHTPILVIEQNTTAALTLCSRAYVMVDGRRVMEGAADHFADRSDVFRTFLGATSAEPA